MPRYTSKLMPPPRTQFDRSVTIAGYVLLGWGQRKGRHWIREHVYVWQTAFGPLPNGYVIHHEDGDRANNELANLRALEKGQHIRLHASIIRGGLSRQEYTRLKDRQRAKDHARRWREGHREHYRTYMREYCRARYQKRRQAA